MENHMYTHFENKDFKVEIFILIWDDLTSKQGHTGIVDFVFNVNLHRHLRHRVYIKNNTLDIDFYMTNSHNSNFPEDLVDYCNKFIKKYEDLKAFI